MKPAINYADIFRGRVLIITGVGRSGTSLMGKILGSFTNTLYLYEPAILKYAPMYKDCDLEGIRGMIFEDYFAQQMMCRSVNIVRENDSYYKNYWHGNGLLKPNGYDSEYVEISTREQVLDFKPVFIIKTNEAQTNLPFLNELFPNCHIVHCVRNGSDVIQSSLARGWYTDEYFNKAVDLMHNGPGFVTPHYSIFERDFYLRKEKYNQVTRCAHVWRVLMDAYDEFDPDHKYCMSYERFLEYKLDIMGLMKAKYNLEPTELTIKNFDSIKTSKHDLITHKIKKQERCKFIDTMKRWGYEVT